MTGVDWTLVVLVAVSAAWMALLGVAAAAGVGRLLAPEVREWSWREWGTLAACVVLFAAGISWGWPGPGWPPDEIQPEMLREALSRAFSGGWFDKYPPGFYYLMTVISAPTLVGHWLDVVDIADPQAHALMQMQARVSSVMAAAGLVAAVMVLAGRWLGPRHAWPAAVAFACTMPVAFYAKTANVESLYLCLVTWSLVCLSRWQAHRGEGALMATAVLAALAIATKDQAAGLYVLPAVYVAVVLRARPGALWAPALAGVAVLAAMHNVVFNAPGVVSHFRELVGPASADYREFGVAPGDQVRLALEVGRQLALMLGWPGLLALGVGVAAVRRGMPMWLWLPCASYYLTFVAPVGYSYDRFLLPFVPALALLMSAGIRVLIDAAPVRRFARPAAALLLAALVGRVVWLDAAMLFDTRYAAERWLHATVPPGAIVATDAPPAHAPRLAGLAQVALRPGVEATEGLQPAFVVVNADYVRRYDGDPVREAWLTWLADGRGPYREVARHQVAAPAPASWLRWLLSPAFGDAYTNLNKISPEIVIYGRQRE